jgi:tetratricopeptide (TPR) repeat protein
LFAENPNNIKDRGRVAISYQMDGEYRALAGDIAGAFESFRKKLQLDEQNLNDDPSNAHARSDVAYSWSRIGELLATKGEYTEALNQERKALEFYEQLSADSPQDVHTRYRTAIVGGIAAKLEAKLGHRAQALAACGKVQGLLKELPEDPADTVHSGLRGQALLHLGAAHAALAGPTELTASQRQEHWRAARDFSQQSLAIWQDMQQRGILTADNAPKLDEMVREVAECDAALASKE